MECPSCKKEFDENTGRRPKKFCSDACKVRFWNGRKNVARKLREAGMLVPPTFDDPNHKPLSPPKVSYFPPHAIEYGKVEIQSQIAKHEADLVYFKGFSSPTSLTKKSIAFAELKIAELQKLIPKP